MDKEMMEQFQMILQGMADMESRLSAKIEESETRTKVFIENQVTKRIESLFDGYKLNHEMQWELERETERLKQQMNDLQIRLAAIEQKVSA